MRPTAAWLRYFGTALLYGVGVAQEVLWAVVGTERGIVNTSKVAMARPPYTPFEAILRRFAKPVLDRSRTAREVVRSLYRRSRSSGAAAVSAQRARDPTPATSRRELDASLRLLKRKCNDVCLAHEPGPDDRRGATAEAFQSLVHERVIGCFGAAITMDSNPWLSFGSVWQSGWVGGAPHATPWSSTRVFRGVVRNAPKDQLGRALVSPSMLLCWGLAEAPDAVFLVAASTPAKVTKLVAEVVA